MSPKKIDLPARLLHGLVPWRNAITWRIAFSGGLDSTVLLHVLAHLAKTESLPALTAIHVHHGLQAAADAWPEHCQSVCDALGVPLEVVRVQVERGASLERAARDARYGAFIAATHAGEVLLTGQHRDDQAETLLFRLMRGAGVRGLSGMPSERPLGCGHLLRPLLDVTRAELEAYATEYQLNWIEDPSNQDRQFSRNYLRHQVFPVLTARWPQAVATMARSAAHLSEAQGLLDDLAQIDLAQAGTDSDFDWLGLPSLELAPLEKLSDARQRNALSHWLKPLTSLPDSDHWSGWQDLRDATGDARPVWRLAAGELHRAGGRLWWLSGGWLRTPPSPVSWADPAVLLALPDNGVLTLTGQIPDGPLQIRYREGGEVMNLPDRGHRDLKRLLNERGVPGFARGRLPLVYRGQQLLAVANLRGLNGSERSGWYLHWQPPIEDQGLS
ncbi:tRNA(Ile)-lysidine synthase [Pseudomonas sp. PvR086]|jgi:tRNA(Ile)-lysidine synthase|uniref:tRNA lysidine(34) synthetase TilS n=1 Tax=Pseudomonas TaxID=286 RepID=UPI000B34AFA1|nr:MULTISPECIES: tRNA lysidine(34) synthetase TilS [Pseudomonas]MBD9605403.1 tRNA lysidine(34) synthetase TilS [Pseudomonas sp. PDM08]MDR7106263.1 tRNA(Ile)-lysidine synthase [Pseudomonas frederiksbergensis]PMY54267.1 tRNA lysidine(34) synthetase TilS [Pseudomonas sp. FW305-53]PMY85045.1 tRNA lysidine(34) synthetase TilS [Pseudomonas sp. FW303-C2]PMY93397.1 tRNA lysidine(34) synthetase TilS [Pseudomonas sp. FW305-62]